jgi:hypothetical protein
LDELSGMTIAAQGLDQIAKERETELLEQHYSYNNSRARFIELK